MNTQTKHTKTPWHVGTNQDEVRAAHCGLVCRTTGDTDQEAAANAAFIVRACNEHAALLAVAEAAKPFNDGTEWVTDGQFLALKTALEKLASVRNQ